MGVARVFNDALRYTTEAESRGINGRLSLFQVVNNKLNSPVSTPIRRVTNLKLT